MKRKLCSMFVAMLATSLLCTIVMAEIDTADHTYSGKLDFTPSADIRIRNGVRLTATSDELNIMDGVTATAAEISIMAGVTATTAEINNSSDRTTNGVRVSTAVTATETLGQVNKTVLTVASTNIYVATGAAKGEEILLYTFPKGQIIILSGVANMTAVNDAHTTGNFVMSVGSTVAAGDATLTGTEADIVASSGNLAGGGAVTTNDFDAVNAAVGLLNGTATAEDVYLCLGMADAENDGNTVVTVQGTITMYWILGGSNQ